MRDLAVLVLVGAMCGCSESGASVISSLSAEPVLNPPFRIFRIDLDSFE